MGPKKKEVEEKARHTQKHTPQRVSPLESIGAVVAAIRAAAADPLQLKRDVGFAVVEMGECDKNSQKNL